MYVTDRASCYESNTQKKIHVSLYKPPACMKLQLQLRHYHHYYHDYHYSILSDVWETFVFVSQIEENPHLLPNVSLELKWDDTHGETIHATKTITQMICDKVAVFFGPEGNTCYTEAIVAQAWNIPMISYVSITLAATTVQYYSIG